MKPTRPLLLFDGSCDMCNASVQWVIARDKRQVLDFAKLQSQAAKSALRNANYKTELPDSLILIANGKVHIFSAAAIGVARTLGFPWSLAALALLIPPPIRDAGYRWIAARRHRYRVNGHTVPHTSCSVSRGQGKP